MEEGEEKVAKLSQNSFSSSSLLLHFYSIFNRHIQVGEKGEREREEREITAAAEREKNWREKYI